MSRHRGVAAVLAVTAAVSVLAACQSAGKGVDPSTLVYGADQEPSALNDWTNTGNGVWSGIVTTPIMGSLMIYTPDYQYAPQLLAQMPTITNQNPLTIHYQILSNAVWSDGTQITANDVQYTLGQVLDPNNDIVSRTGYDKIKGGKLADISSDGKQFDLVFAEQFAPWRELFTSSTAPLVEASAMQGKDFNTYLNDYIPFSSGPYMMTQGSWKKGQQLTLTANPKYWGSPKPKIKTIVFKFMKDTDTQVKSLESQEAQAIYPQPQTGLVQQLQGISTATFKVDNGPQWEHLDFNETNPLLADKAVRQALVYLVNRNDIVARVAKPTSPNVQVLQNVFYVPNQSDYKAAGWTTYPNGGNPAMAAQLLQQDGYVKGADGVWAKNGQPLTFKISTTSGNKSRELTEQILIEAWKNGGIAVSADNATADELFQRIPQCQYDIALFAFTGGPDPFGANSIYSDDTISCPGPGGGVKGGQNSTAYKSSQVTQLIRQADVTLDPSARAALYNQANVVISQDPPTLPLFQKADVLSYDNAVKGMTPNSTTEGPSWNAQDWSISTGS